VCLLAAGAVPAEERGQALEPRLAGRALVDALAEGGYVVLLRHASTETVAPDPALRDLADCDTQRNLSDAGRREAVQIGRAAEALGIRFSKVLSSPYCRCVETARLAFGDLEVADELSIGEDLTVPERTERGRAVRGLVNQTPAEGTNTVLVVHSANLLYSFGLDIKPEGVAHVFQPSEFGGALYVGRLDPGDWVQLAGLDPSAPIVPPRSGPSGDAPPTSP
jgi:phosphohistidine phosphatase SixA